MNSIMTRKYSKKNTRKSGGCGCQSQNKILGGGTLGPASFTNFDTNHTYIIPYNTSVGLKNIDPIDASNVISTRMQPNITGGKNKRKTLKSRKVLKSSKIKKSRKSLKKRSMKGGNYVDMMNGNVQSTFLQTSGMLTSSNVVSGTHNEVLNSEPRFLKNTPLI
jgi:hypothetical protein